ncbi:conserved lipothrixviral protein [Sulfolobus islandicus filamentous virus 2]|uniref:Conserved lipothrixviral protein n=1 Tax=Sulfolobus islandicus filamentous virus 2 TaxID=1902331 RepID=A0A1D8BJ70_SIFV|nr:conserved lipothrixviral protein [Sulfolobus islandicus filamentous virus 2]
MAKQEVKQDRTDELKTEIDKWVEEFTKSQKRFSRFDVYEGEQLSLGFIAYKDDKNNVNVLISMHGQKPTNSVSFPASALEDIKAMLKIVEKYEKLFKYVEKFETNAETNRKKKILLE